MDAGTLITSQENNVRRLCFSHPKANCFPRSLLLKLRNAFQEAAADPEVRVICLESGGEGAFSAGASFDEFRTLGNEKDAEEFFYGFAEVILAMRAAPQLVLAVVPGKAVGGALGLIAAADYVVATTEAQIRLSEFALDIGPFTIAAAVERKLGLAHFSALSIDTNWRSAEWASSAGLYSSLHSTREQAEAYAEELLATLSKRSPEATAELKKLLWSDTEGWELLFQERAKSVAKLLLSAKEKGTI